VPYISVSQILNEKVGVAVKIKVGKGKEVWAAIHAMYK
jgi:hypothetical protein